jgi:hypothetical protein
MAGESSFFAVVLPAIWFSGMGYMWLIEHWQKLDSDATSEGVLDQLLNLVTVLPVLPVIVAAILISGIPWMFVVSRILSWADIQYYTKQKGRRIPFLSDWLDRLWLRMIESRRPKSPTSGSSE